MSDNKDDTSHMRQTPHEPLTEVAHLDAFYHSKTGHVVAHFLRKQIQPDLKLEITKERLAFGYPFYLPAKRLPSCLNSKRDGRSHVMGHLMMEDGQHIL